MPGPTGPTGPTGGLAAATQDDLPDGTTYKRFNPAALAVTGGSATGLTELGVRDTSAAFDVDIAATSSTALTAKRTLTVDMVNASRTLKVTANAEIGGINTGDQTVGLLTSGVTTATNIVVTDGDSMSLIGYQGYLLFNETPTVINSAVSGRDLSDMVDAAPSAVDTQWSFRAKHNVCVVWGGSNDFYHNKTLNAAYSELMAYCRARKRAGWQVVVVTMPSRTGSASSGFSLDSYSRQFNAAIRLGFANGSLPCDAIADIAANSLLGAAGAYSNAAYFPDGIHPSTAAALTIIAGKVSAAVNSLVRPWKSGVYGYSLGGNTGDISVITDCTTFATQATAALASANLSQARFDIAGFSDCAKYGYALGGFTTVAVVTANCTTFSTQATAALTSANLSAARYALAGFSDGMQFGYALGGITGPVATADCTTFATQATAALTSANLSQARYIIPGLSDGALYGYVLGGSIGTVVATADCTTFATQATAALTSANLSQARYGSATFGDCVKYGYALAGYAGGYVVTTDYTTFATRVTAALTSANLSVARAVLSGMSDGRSFGYSLGGNTGSLVATADCTTFATQATAALASANLSAARFGAAGFSDYNV